MPFVVAGVIYLGAALLVLGVVLVRRRSPRSVVLVATLASAVGFVVGCAAAVLVLVAGAGGGAPASPVVTAGGLIGATAAALAASLLHGRRHARRRPDRITPPGDALERT